MITLFKRGMGMVFLMTVTFTHAQITTADNGLTATGTAPNKNVGLGGTLNDAQTSIDFNTSNSNSSFLLKKGTASYFLLNNSGTAKFFKSITLGDTYPNAPNEHVINYMGDQYGGRGLKLVNNYTGSMVRLHSLSNGLYATKDDGSPAPIVSENFSNASDGSTLRATLGRWEINSGIFTVNQWWTGAAQFEMTVASATRKGIVIKSAPSQTETLMEWQNNSGIPLSYINSAGALSIGNNGVTNSGYKLNVNGDAEIGDDHDTNAYGMLQLVRPSNQPDNKFHLSFIRNGISVSGMGYAPNSNVLGIWHSNNNSGTPLIAMTYEQKVGIGVSNPADKLTVGGTDGNITIGGLFGEGYNGIFLNGSTNPSDYNFLSKAGDKNLYINRPSGSGIYFRQANLTHMVIVDGGNVGIGTTEPGTYKLAVEGTIGARKVKVTTASWADFVFDKGYDLPTLTEVDQFIKANKHLPGVPSAKEVENNGLDLGDGQAILLKKIEELTLYLLEQNKRINDQQLEIEKLQKEINKVKK